MKQQYTPVVDRVIYGGERFTICQEANDRIELIGAILDQFGTPPEVVSAVVDRLQGAMRFNCAGCCRDLPISEYQEFGWCVKCTSAEDRIGKMIENEREHLRNEK